MNRATLNASAVGSARHLVTGLRLHGPLWAVELMVINASFLVAFIVRYGGRVPGYYWGRTALTSSILLSLCYSIASLVFRSYRSVWRFVSLRDMGTVAITVATAILLLALMEVTVLSEDRPIPLSALLMGGGISYLALTHLKLSSRLRHARRNGAEKHSVLVVGAGAAGIALVRQLDVEPSALRAVAFIDDDRRKVGRIVAGLPVVGDRSAIRAAVQRHRARAIAIAVPSASPAARRELYLAASQAGVRILTVPGVRERPPGQNGITLRQLSLEDLVGRREVVVAEDVLRHAISGRRVLVTGAAGSIGSEIARQVSRLAPAALVLIDNNETGLTDLRDELEADCDPRIHVVSVFDATAVRRVFGETRPQLVLHAAALKHVDIVEHQPREAALVNVLGTWICARAAEAVGAERFLLISTDKAVSATNVLGASKRIGELLMASLARSGRTEMFAVRFGNVVGSRGSVVPRFERQIAGGGPITITHPDVRRYFMSIPEAVRLVLQSTTVARSGHIYVLDMGDQIPIIELAVRLAGIRGFRVPEDIPIIYTGLRPGERLSEQLIQPGELSRATDHPQITELTEPGPATPEHWDAALRDLELLTRFGETATIRDRLFSLAAVDPRVAPVLTPVPAAVGSPSRRMEGPARTRSARTRPAAAQGSAAG